VSQRVAVFIDYQNVYQRARGAFGATHHMDGQIRPLAAGLALRGPSRDLVAVHVYRGLPSSTRDPKGYEAAQRQIAAWSASAPDVVSPHTRPLNYRVPSNPREKGIDVMLAVDFVTGILQNLWDVGIIFSDDTDLHPALEAVGELRGPGHCELAGWRDPTRSGPRIVQSGGQTVFTRLLDGPDYERLRDNQDYTHRNARKQRPPRRP